MEDDKTYSTREVSEKLGYSYEYIRRVVKKNHIKPVLEFVSGNKTIRFWSNYNLEQIKSAVGGKAGRPGKK